jgi:hypothetical protein
METRVAYCSACDRPVRVVVEGGAPRWSGPREADLSTVLCLEHGDTCTGSMCPIFDVPPEEMAKRLKRYRAAQEVAP